MTIMSLGSNYPEAEPIVKNVEVSKENLKAFVRAGIIKRTDNHKEHFAIEPFWNTDPGRGVLEEINSYTLGRWNKKLKAYVVAVHNIRNSDSSAGLNEDHRWLHVDICATYYTYTPEEGQILTGEIQKIGNRAAICNVFDVFTATVFAADEAELKSWNMGDNLTFKIYSFVDRRKGPILRAKCLEAFDPKIQVDNEDYYEAASFPIVNGDGEEQEEEFLHTETEKSKKKKKKRKKNDDAESESFSNCNILAEDHDSLSIESPTKKKKKKKSSE